MLLALLVQMEEMEQLGPLAVLAGRETEVSLDPVVEMDPTELMEQLVPRAIEEIVAPLVLMVMMVVPDKKDLQDLLEETVLPDLEAVPENREGRRQFNQQFCGARALKPHGGAFRMQEQFDGHAFSDEVCTIVYNTQSSRRRGA